MTDEKLYKAIGDINETYVADAKILKKPKKAVWTKYGAIAACLALALLTVSMVNNQEKIQLTDASNGVTVKYAKDTPDFSSSGKLVALSEEELFAKNTEIFKGTIVSIDNIVLDFNGIEQYRAIAKIAIEEVYRGNGQIDETISVLLPGSVHEELKREDTETISAMREGMTGIFMPIVYDETSVWTIGDSTLAFKDIADYGFSDGSRYTFLETDDGVIFDKSAYTSIADANTLNEIKEYVIERACEKISQASNFPTLTISQIA